MHPSMHPSIHVPAPPHGQARRPPPLLLVSRPCYLRDGDSDRLRKRRRSGDGVEVAGEPGHEEGEEEEEEEEEEDGYEFAPRG